MVETDLCSSSTCDNLGHEAAVAHKMAAVGRLRELTERAGARDANALAEELLLVMDGAWSAGRVFGSGATGDEPRERRRT
jgi:hypothetical protein